VSGFSGDEGDAIAAPVHPGTISNGMQFSCLGADNDRHPYQCFSVVPAGWWTNNCDRSVINIDTNGIWNAVTNAIILDVVSSRMLVKLY